MAANAVSLLGALGAAQSSDPGLLEDPATPSAPTASERPTAPEPDAPRTTASAEAASPASADAAPLGEAPDPLRCLVRDYAARAVQDPIGVWWLELPTGARVAYDDGRAKSFSEALETPDVRDVFRYVYRAGPIVPVAMMDEDPGRIRLEPLFRATYGATEKEVAQALAPVALRGRTVRVHKKIAAPLRRVAVRLDAAARADPSIDAFFEHLGGSFAWRPVAGTDRLSAHSWAVALDLNPSLGNYWRDARPPVWRNRVPGAIVTAFESEGFIWGGRWFHFDTMHFEYRPELLDPSCSPHPEGDP